MRLIAIALLLVGCIEEHEGPGVTGSPADVVTPPGDYVGYRVVMPCTNPFPDVGVTGTGSVVLTQTSEISAAGQDLKLALGDVASIWGWGGAALACESGVGTAIWLSDWRDVDVVIARAGAWLVAHDYNLQVGVGVDGVPVPQASD